MRERSIRFDDQKQGVEPTARSSCVFRRTRRTDSTHPTKVPQPGGGPIRTLDVALAEVEWSRTVSECRRARDSDRQGELVERVGQPVLGRRFDSEFVVASPEVLNEGVTGG